MKPFDKSNNFFIEKNKLYTKKHPSCQGKRLFDEDLIVRKKVEYRSWNPYRSKLAAALLNGLVDVKLDEQSKVLYLGAAAGSTMSYISDIAVNGMVYAVEFSSFSMKKLVGRFSIRNNVVPILADANHPEKYQSVVSKVDFLYQDVSQRNQAEIFIKNADWYLRKSGQGILMVKSKSVDVSLSSNEVYELIEKKLSENGFKVVKSLNLKPYEKNHAALLVEP